jgi:hypothetical protein
MALFEGFWSSLVQEVVVLPLTTIRPDPTAYLPREMSGSGVILSLATIPVTSRLGTRVSGILNLVAL